MKPTHQIEYRKLSEMKELPGNPRTIKKEQFEKLKKSIKDNPDYFEARPIILSDRTGKLVIIAGNQRYKAAKAIGLTEVPTITLKGLTEERERELIIRDNVENGDWDMDILANEWDAAVLESWGVMEAKMFASNYGTDFALNNGDGPLSETMSFTLAPEQAELIRNAMGKVEADDEIFGNKNKNGNKLYEIVRQWAELKTS